MMRINLAPKSKVCTKCLVMQPLEAFYPTTRRPGRTADCRDCRKAYRALPDVKARVARYNASIAEQQAEREKRPEVRAKLLCAGCNDGLGKIRDNADALRRLAAYVESFR